MITEYIKCPVPFAEYQQLDETSVDEYINYLEARRYSHGTITSYVSCVVHYFSWRRGIAKSHSVEIFAKHIRSS